MKKRLRFFWTFLTTAALFFFSVVSLYADMRTADAPHNSTIDMECGHCHVIYGGSALLPPWYSDPVSDIDDTMDNRVCWSCHNGVTAPFKETHSSRQLGTEYGIWTSNCTDCHWKNFDAHGRQSQAGQQNFTYRVTGTVASRGAYDMATGTTPLTVVGTTGETTWSASRWKDYIVFVDDPSSSTGQKSYKIRECDASSNNGGQGRFTVLGNASTTPVGTAFRVMRGGYINTTMPTNGLRVKYFDNSGNYGFIGVAEPGVGICEVCHTQNRFFRQNGVKPEPHLPSTENCLICHLHTNGFVPAGGCNMCHGQSTENGYPTTVSELANPATGEGVGSHSIHIPLAGGDNRSTCNVCHNGHTMPSQDKKITMGFTGIAGTAGVFDGASSLSNGYSYGGAYTSAGSLTCSNVNCHDNGTGTPGITPAWGIDAPACTACHAAAPATGSHSAHLNYAYAAITCADCHKGAIQSVQFSDEHLDGNVDVYTANVGDLGYPINKAKGSAYTSCSSTYCHNPENGLNTSPVWGASLQDSAQCDSCHGGNASSTLAAGLGPMMLGRHNAHVNNADPGLGNIPCGRCHAGTVTTGDDRTITGSLHINRTADVLFDSLNPGATDCTTLYCHSDGKGNLVPPPGWTTGGQLGCGGCHGAGTTNGYPNYENTGPGTEYANDHRSHSQSANCFYCHYDTTRQGLTIVAGVNSHINRSRDIDIHPAFNGSCSDHQYHTQASCEAASQVWTVSSFDPVAKTCSNVTCHFGSVQWGVDPAQVTAECGVCHETPPLDDPGVTQPHSIHYGIANEGVVPNKYGDRHVASTQTNYGFYCGTCHPSDPRLHQDDPSNGSSFTPKLMEIRLGAIDTNGDGTVDSPGPVGRGAIPAYSTASLPTLKDPGVARNEDGSPVFYYGYHRGTCANIYCHSNGRGGNPNTTPSWALNVAPADCTYCHGNDVSSAIPMASGSHNTHVVRVGRSCVECHNDTVSSNRTIKDRRRHVSNYFDPATGDPINAGVPAVDVAWGSINTGADPYNTATDTCSKLYCHSTGQGQANPLNPPAYSTPRWGDTASGQCGTCHGLGAHPQDSTTRIASGSHGKHLEYFFGSIHNLKPTCQMCHFLPEGTDMCSICHPQTSFSFKERPHPTHVNRSINVAFDPSVAGIGPSYSGSPAPGNAYGSCSNVYCHSLGNVFVQPSQLPPAYNSSIYASPAWGGQLLCNGCHGRSSSSGSAFYGAPDYENGGVGTVVSNSHSEHATVEIGCSSCHFKTTRDGVSINTLDDDQDGAADGYLYHLNKISSDVYFNPSDNYNATYDPGTKTCSNMTCHPSSGGEKIWGDVPVP